MSPWATPILLTLAVGLSARLGGANRDDDPGVEEGPALKDVAAHQPLLAGLANPTAGAGVRSFIQERDVQGDIDEKFAQIFDKEVNGVSYVKSSPRYTCPDTQRYQGSNKACCTFGTFGLCYAPKGTPDILNPNPYLGSVVTELANLESFRTVFGDIANLRTVRTSKAFLMPSKDHPGAFYAGFLLEWMQGGKEVHPSTNEELWKKDFSAAVSDPNARMTLKGVLQGIKSKLILKNDQYRKVVDFQGFVMPNGEFVAMDLGQIQSDVGGTQAKFFAKAIESLA